MATATAKLGAVIKLTDTASVTVFEGDLIENLVYQVGSTRKTISGSIRVINASTKANNTIPESCPPEPYVHRYVTISSLTIDSSEVYDAEMTRINISSIISIGAINGDKISVAIGGQTYDNLTEAVNAAKNGDTITIMDDMPGVVKIPAGKSLTIEGVDDPVLSGGIEIAATGNVPMNVTIRNLILDGTNGSQYGIVSQNQTDKDQMALSLTLDNVVFKNHDKAVYVTNAQFFGMVDCNVVDGSVLDSAIDLNLIGVQDAVVSIDGCTFDGNCGSNTTIKIAQRGGASDANATDVPKIPEASVESVDITGCTFLDNAPANIQIGTTNKDSKKLAVNTTGAFPVTVSVNKSASILKMAYNDSMDEPGGNSVILPAGRIAQKTATTDFTMTRTK